MPLKLSLKPGEKIIINGAVVANGPHKTELVLQNRASVLRQRDIVTEESATTPARNLYYLIQLMYLFPEGDERRTPVLKKALLEFGSAAPSGLPMLFTVSQLVVDGRLYEALQACKKLIAHEDKIFDMGKEGAATAKAAAKERTAGE